MFKKKTSHFIVLVLALSSVSVMIKTTGPSLNKMKLSKKVNN